MKIPLVKGGMGVPGAYHQPMPSRALPNAWQGVAASVHQASDAITQALNVYGEREEADKKREEAERQRLSRIEADDLDSQFQLAVLEQLDKHATITDPDEYTKAMTDALAGVRTEISGRAKQPYTKQILESKINGRMAAETGKALEHGRVLRNQHVGATVTRTLDNIERLAGQVPIADSAGFAGYVAQGEGLLEDAAPNIGGAEAARKLAIAHRERLFSERAERHSREDPGGFLGAVGSLYGGLDPMKRNAYVAGAETRIIDAVKQNNAEREKYFVALDKEAEQERESQMIDLRAQGVKGTLSVAAIDMAKATRVITTQEEYATLYKLATTAAVRESNPDVRMNADLRSNRTVPTITEAELDREYKAGRLNEKDWDTYKTRVMDRNKGLKAEGLTERKFRHQQAEQVMQAGIGIAGPQDKWDKQDLQLWSFALADLTARSNAYDGKEDSLAVARDIGERYAPIRQRRMKLQVEEIIQTLKYPAPDLQTAWDRLNEQRARLLKEGRAAEILREERKLMDLTRAINLAGPKVGDKAKETGAKLRPPGTKPESGKVD